MKMYHIVPFSRKNRLSMKVRKYGMVQNLPLNPIFLLASLSSSVSTLSFDSLPFFFMIIPAAILHSFIYLRCTCSFVKPSCSPVCLWINPFSLSSIIYYSHCSICLYSLDIAIPPMVGIFIFYHRRVFFSTVRFLWTCAILGSVCIKFDIKYLFRRD